MYEDLAKGEFICTIDTDFQPRTTLRDEHNLLYITLFFSFS